MLQVALAPAPSHVAQIDQGRRALLVTARQRGGHWTAQPARRTRAASMKSWLMTCPPNGLRPFRWGRPAASANADVCTIALWPQ